MKLLVTGGAGYIGSTVVLDLLAAGHRVVVIDDLSTGYREAVRRVEQLAGQDVPFVHADIADAAAVRRALSGVDAVLHFAAFKVVGESMAHPERYLANNVGALGTLFGEMERAGVRRLVYSSSAAVYGTQREMPIAETAPLLPESPYGLSKVHGEQWIDWMVRCHGWSAVSLRYFNPVGAHASGRIGQPVEGAQALLPRALLALVRSSPSCATMPRSPCSAPTGPRRMAPRSATTSTSPISPPRTATRSMRSRPASTPSSTWAPAARTAWPRCSRPAVA